MAMNAQSASPPLRWSVPVAVDSIPETGLHLELAPDSETRESIAQAAAVNGLPELTATFDLSRQGPDGLHVTGRLSATVGQTCVVTLEPIESRVEEEIDLLFLPPREPSSGAGDEELAHDTEEPPEPLHNGKVDLATVVLEFLILGIDPYPRKPDAVFEAPAESDKGPHPFAALAALKKSADNGKS